MALAVFFFFLLLSLSADWPEPLILLLMKADGQIIFAYRARFLPFFYRFQSGDKRGETEEEKLTKETKRGRETGRWGRENRGQGQSEKKGSGGWGG